MNLSVTDQSSIELAVNDDGHPSKSSDVQSETEQDCLRFYVNDTDLDRMGLLKKDELGNVENCLLREKTIKYLRRGLINKLGPSYTSLDASRPWLIYWMLHALELLDAFPNDLVPGIFETLKICRAPNGVGFGGGFMQEGHTAATYASVLAICTIGTKEAYNIIDRGAIYQFFLGLKHESGGFRVQKDGEMDTRGLYTVLAVASLLNILTPELTEGCAEFVSRCQTFEGGIGGEPGNEAHGGYTFCALAALCILDRKDAIDVHALVDWIAMRQMRLEGGFQGRTNKLVDACYSFWQGAVPVLLREYFGIQVPEISSEMLQSAKEMGLVDQLDRGSFIFAQLRLQQYLLLCCQFYDGGLHDKPGKSRDQYHTCYALSGLSLAQQNGIALWGDKGNILKETDPVYNVQVDKVKAAKEFFAAQPPLALSD